MAHLPCASPGALKGATVERTSLTAAWESFYVIVGSSAAALTGLQFVVMTLIATDETQRSDSREVSAFGSPTVVHFCAVLLFAAILSAPWQLLASAGVVLTICGIAGIAYVGLVIRRARATRLYKPVLEDWIWHAVLPLLAYATLLVAALSLHRHAASSLFAIGAASLLLLFIGIHNAWDTVTYVALDQSRRREQGKAE
jgi:hypothetical protein